MNGYFQLMNDDMQTSVMLYPATDGDEDLDIGEVADYLSGNNISYDQGALYNAGRKLDEEPMQVVLNLQRSRPQPEMVKVRISSDGMSAKARFYAPSNDGEAMSREEILNELKYHGILYGILEDVVDEFVADREYCCDYEIAVGRERNNGEDARIEYSFDFSNRAKPTLKEDGSVDFFNLNVISACHKGDVLATLIPKIPAKPGRTVKGEMLMPKEPRDKLLRHGKNTILSDDGTQIIALSDGHIVTEGERVSVVNVLELASVDSSTGNINYTGSVHVSGNVCENYAVSAEGNVIVDGVVEGAVVKAEGDVIIARGMNGMGKGRIVAGGNVVAKFFENADVTADGYVSSDSILHSTVSTKDTVSVGGKRGFITGGNIRAANGIQVKTLGSSMGSDTIVEVGADPSLKQRIVELQTSLQENTRRAKNVYPILMSATDKVKKGVPLSKEQKDYIKEVHAQYMQYRKEIKRANSKLEKMNRTLENGKDATVSVTGEVFAGTRVVIGDVSMVVKGKNSYCKFVREQGDVKIKPL